MLAVPNPVPPPLAITEAEAVTFLRTVARMHGGFAIKVYGGGRSPPLRVRAVRGYAVMLPSGNDMTWDSRLTWLYSLAQGLLLWGAPNVLKGHAAYVTWWRGIDDPTLDLVERP